MTTVSAVMDANAGYTPCINMNEDTLEKFAEQQLTICADCALNSKKGMLHVLVSYLLQSQN